MTVMSKKGRRFFKEKNRGDTLSCRPGCHPPYWRHWWWANVHRRSC